ncbi:MAG: hypothetical protein HUJ31_16285, partial [Pseudomonadales bacterium]|nr:hypothetical protein [Pseudomonadales bacterium]
MSQQVFVGIDVAFAKNKKLPVCIAINDGDRLVPLELKGPKILPIPRGSGNAATLDPDTAPAFAHAVLACLPAV